MSDSLGILLAEDHGDVISDSPLGRHVADRKSGIPTSTVAVTFPAQSSVVADGETVRSGESSPKLKRSGIPEGGLRHPRSVEDCIKLSDLASLILFNAYGHVSAENPSAAKILGDLHREVSAACIWLLRAETLTWRWKKYHRGAA